MCCGTPAMCACCKNGKVAHPTPCIAEDRPCVQVDRTVTSPPHPMCCGTQTMCASCKNGNITHPTPCVAEHRQCTSVENGYLTYAGIRLPSFLGKSVSMLQFVWKYFAQHVRVERSVSPFRCMVELFSHAANIFQFPKVFLISQRA